MTLPLPPELKETAPKQTANKLYWQAFLKGQAYVCTHTPYCLAFCVIREKTPH